MQPVAEHNDEEMDEEQILQQAMMLSMNNQANKQQQQQDNTGQQNQFSEFLDNDFVGQIVKDLNLDMNESDINSLLNEVNKGP